MRLDWYFFCFKGFRWVGFICVSLVLIEVFIKFLDGIIGGR